MSIIVKKNEYELANAIYKRYKKLGKDIEVPLKMMLDAKADQDKQIVLGGLCRIHYRRYWHDPTPLALFMSYTKPEYRCVPAVNLHYLTAQHALAVVEAIIAANTYNIKAGRPFTVTYDMLKALGLPTVAYRLYKWQYIRPIEYVPVDDWRETAKKERSQWQGKFYGLSQKATDRRKAIKRKVQNKNRKKRVV